MGAVPRFFMLSSARCRQAEPARGWTASLKEWRGLRVEFGMVLIGGDTSQNPTVIMNLTVGGDVAAGQRLTRSGARPGDGIYVSGTLGAAQLGLELVLRGVHRDRRYEAIAGAASASKDSTRTRALAGWRTDARHPIASAATDTSDGLSTDLTHICQSSGVSARIFAAQIPVVKIPKSLRGGIGWIRSNWRCTAERTINYCSRFRHSEAHRVAESDRGSEDNEDWGNRKHEATPGSQPIELWMLKDRRTPLIRRGWDSFASLGGIGSVNIFGRICLSGGL